MGCEIVSARFTCPIRDDQFFEVVVDLGDNPDICVSSQPCSGCRVFDTREVQGFAEVNFRTQTITFQCPLLDGNNQFSMKSE